MRRVWAAVAVAVWFGASGCLHWPAAAGGDNGPVGLPWRGLLGRSETLPRKGRWLSGYRADERRWGTPDLVRLIERAAARVHEAAPGAEIRVGDLGARHGGAIPGHRSHRTGLDADLAFFASDALGRPIAAMSSTRFDRFGVGMRRGSVVRFDTRLNWLVVEALLSDNEVPVQWIFVSNGLKALLLAHAVGRGRDSELVERAASVLHQPGRGAPHDDHFHVRIFCPAASRTCVDTGPVWPWAERSTASASYADERIVALALEGLSPG